MRQKGRCTTCGKPSGGFSQCEFHREKKSKDATALYHKRKEAKVCTECGKNSAWIGKSLRCFDCCKDKAAARRKK